MLTFILYSGDLLDVNNLKFKFNKSSKLALLEVTAG